MRNDAIAHSNDCPRAMTCCDKQILIVQIGSKRCHCLSCWAQCTGCVGDYFEGCLWGKDKKEEVKEPIKLSEAFEKR